MDILSKLPERLKELMFDRGINAPNLAEKLDVGANTITRYLQGVSTPNFDILSTLSSTLTVRLIFCLVWKNRHFTRRNFFPCRRLLNNSARRWKNVR